MDMDIQFGDLEEAKPEVHLRPDLNKHFCVTAVHAPEADDLPIFVDIDVMRDIETHAQTDKSVELGGVLLGGQYEDEDGNSFVVVNDSLRAEHYEATKGSFKFTHETWEKISRQRDEFPDDVQMVGWYHTHPDWGVFLSGMDMFICNNFFNRLLDVALVVDPCRDDRGWFMWTGANTQQVRRTGGFFLYGSRFRKAELEYFAQFLKGGNPMAVDPRFSPIAGQIGAPSAPVVNILDTRGQTQQLALLGMLSLQFLLMALIAWRVLAPGMMTDKSDMDDMARIESKLDGLAKAQLAEARSEGEAATRQSILEALSGSKDIAADYEQKLEQLSLQRTENRALALSHRALEDRLRQRDDQLSSVRKTAKSNLDRKAFFEKKYEEERLAATALEEELELLKENNGIVPLYRNKMVWLGGAVLVCIAGLLGFFGALAFKRHQEFEDDDSRPAFEFDDHKNDKTSDADDGNQE